MSHFAAHDNIKQQAISPVATVIVPAHDLELIAAFDVDGEGDMDGFCHLQYSRQLDSLAYQVSRTPSYLIQRCYVKKLKDDSWQCAYRWSNIMLSSVVHVSGILFDCI